MPVEAAFTRAGRALGDFARYLSAPFRRSRELDRLAAEVQRLKSENAQLLGRIADLEADIEETAEIRRTLPAVRLEFILAPVIGRDSCTWSRTLAVGRGRSAGVRPGQLVLSPTTRLVAGGSRDGIEEGDAVLSGARLVGRVAEVGPFHSVIRLLTDPDSVMRAQVVGRRGDSAFRSASGILRGSLSGSTRLRLEYVHRRREVREGDTVLSAGYGGVLPRPVVVGTVERVEPARLPLLWDVTVKPAADLSSLRRVVILRELPLADASAGGGDRP